MCILFGDYKGTVRDGGFRWANPFYSRSMGSNASAEDATAEVLSKSSLSLGKQISVAAKASNNLSTKVSVRARTLNGEILKVNDKMGNPIEIANVVVWHVEDTAKALFDVDQLRTVRGHPGRDGAAPRGERVRLRPPWRTTPMTRAPSRCALTSRRSRRP